MVINLDKYNLDNLYNDLLEKKDKEITNSYTSFLLKNKKLLAKKIGEEATEVLIEYINDDKKNLINESADLLYHLNVMWLSMEISPNDIWKEFLRRKNISGFAEKNNSKKNEI